MLRIISIVGLLLLSLFSEATDTQIMVRAKAKDAKFIGSSIGGALVIIRNQQTGEVMATGITEGSTGNTELIMNTPVQRRSQLTDEKTAGYLATVDINEPTLIRVEVTAPINQRQSMAVATTELWLIPGKHLTGDGIVLEIPGYVIDVLTPRAHERITLSSLENGEIKIQANIVMMCGCPITSGGIWDADGIEVKAQIKKDGALTDEISLSVTETSLFEGSFQPAEAGNFEIIIYAYDPVTSNTGVDKVNFILN